MYGTDYVISINYLRLAHYQIFGRLLFVDGSLLYFLSIMHWANLGNTGFTGRPERAI